MIPAFPRTRALWALIGVALVTMSGCQKAPEAKNKGPGNAMYVVDVLTVQPQPFRETLFATGSLVPNESIQLQSERAGVVTQISFEESKPVKAGEVLLRIDDSELQAQLDRAKAQLELTKAAEVRQQNLLKNRGISPADYDQAKANLEIAQAEVQLIQAQIAKTRIEAPFDGVPGLRRVSLGAYLTPGTMIGTFQDISTLKIDFTLPERYLGLVEAGQKVRFRITGGVEWFEATVAAIEPAVDVQTRSLTVRALMPNANQRLLPGAFAEVEISLEQFQDALLVPAIALIPGLQKQTLLIHRDGVVEERQVQAGIRTSDSVQIIAGLKPGEEVITSGILQLRKGMKVKTRPAATNPQIPGADGLKGAETTGTLKPEETPAASTNVG